MTEQKDVADIFGQLFETQESGDEGLLKIASQYSLQMSGYQIKGMLMLKLCGIIMNEQEPEKTIPGWLAEQFKTLKQYNKSAPFVMRSLDSISLRKFIGENTFKVNVDK